MSVSTPPSPSPQDTARRHVDPSALTRRELQYLARELELCRGNAKSDVIVEHVCTFMASDGGAARVATLLDAMPDEYKARTPGATPARRTRETLRETVTPQAMDFADDGTPMRRSPRTSSRSGADEATTTQETESSPAKRKINFAVGDCEETSNEETPVAKKPKTQAPVERANKAATPTKDSKAPVEDTTSAPKITKSAENVTTTATLTKSEDHELKAPTKKDKEKATPAKVLDPLPTLPTDSSKTPPRRSAMVKNGRSPLANVSNLATEHKSKLSKVEALLQTVDDLVAVGSDRVKCTTTGHEMKAVFEVISAYISGKRYQRARHQKVSFARFAPMFVDHPDEKQAHLVWCNVTQTSIARTVERIEAHIKGARYQKELPVWQAEQAAKARGAAENEAAPASPKRKAISPTRRVKVARKEAM